MIFQQAYQFETETIANRFLNDVTSGTIANVKAKLYRDSFTVKIEYSPLDSANSFDTRTAELDDLAAYYQGVEVR